MIKRKQRRGLGEAIGEDSSFTEDATNLVTSHSWAWYLLSLAVPFAGIFIALALYDQDSREVRKVGRNCLLVGFLIWVAFPVLILLGLLLLGAATVLSTLSDLMPTD